MAGFDRCTLDHIAQFADILPGTTDRRYTRGQRKSGARLSRYEANERGTATSIQHGSIVVTKTFVRMSRR